nr:fasciclin-2-like [Leptinotarsa decemlineata]
MDLICLFLEGNEISLFQILFSFFSATYGHQPSLEIQPNQKVVTKEVGGSLALTCRPNVQDPGLVTQLEWRDPRNRRIDSSNRANSVYVQMLAGEPGAVLIFSSLTENQAGKYTCHAFYANTESLSASVELNTYTEALAKLPCAGDPAQNGMRDGITSISGNKFATPCLDWLGHTVTSEVGNVHISDE